MEGGRALAGRNLSGVVQGKRNGGSWLPMANFYYYDREFIFVFFYSGLSLLSYELRQETVMHNLTPFEWGWLRTTYANFPSGTWVMVPISIMETPAFASWILEWLLMPGTGSQRLSQPTGTDHETIRWGIVTNERGDFQAFGEVRLNLRGND